MILLLLEIEQLSLKEYRLNLLEAVDLRMRAFQTRSPTIILASILSLIVQLAFHQAYVLLAQVVPYLLHFPVGSRRLRTGHRASVRNDSSHQSRRQRNSASRWLRPSDNARFGIDKPGTAGSSGRSSYNRFYGRAVHPQSGPLAVPLVLTNRLHGHSRPAIDWLRQTLWSCWPCCWLSCCGSR